MQTAKAATSLVIFDFQLPIADCEPLVDKSEIGNRQCINPKDEGLAQSRL
jgi:hypothetical protein